MAGQEERILRKIAQLQEREKRRTEKKKQQPQVKEQPQAEENPADNIIRKGDTVRLDGQDTTGEVMEINGKNITVAFGNLLSTITADRLKKSPKTNTKNSAHTAPLRCRSTTWANAACGSNRTLTSAECAPTKPSPK